MLATTVSACLRASCISAMWPSCRLPMVGTKTMPPASRRAARQASMVSRIRISVAVRFGREQAFAHFVHVAGDGFLDAGRAVHVVLDEARRLAGEDAEHVVEHQHLAVAVRAGADADGGH